MSSKKIQFSINEKEKEKLDKFAKEKFLNIPLYCLYCIDENFKSRYDKFINDLNIIEKGNTFRLNYFEYLNDDDKVKIGSNLKNDKDYRNLLNIELIEKKNSKTVWLYKKI